MIKQYKLSVGLVLALVCISPFFAQDVLWEKTYGGLQSEYLYDVVPTPDYGFLLVGSSLSGKSGNKLDERVHDLDYWLWKMDETGSLEWQRSYGGNGSDFLYSVSLTLEGGFVLAGNSTSGEGYSKREASRGKEDIWILRLSPKGDELWQKTIGGTGRDVVKQIVTLKDGGFIIGGSTDSHPASEGTVNIGEKKSDKYGNMDYWVIRLDSSGEIEWERTYGGIYRDELESIIPTQDGGFLVGGHSNSPVSGNKNEDGYGQTDYWIIKLDKLGNIQWQRTFGGEHDDRLSVIIESIDGHFIAAGNSASGATGNKQSGNGKGTDFWLIKIDDAGEVIWEETFDIGQNDVLTSLIENEDGSLLLGGYAQSETTGIKSTDKKGINDYVAIKIDFDRQIIWQREIGSTGTDILRKVVETRDGGYLLAGTSNGTTSRDKNSSQGRNDFWVVKLRDKDKEDKMRAPGLEAYPNPTSTFTNVIVNHDFEQATVTVIDILGRQMQRFKANYQTIPVNMQGYPEGVYIITVETEKKKESIKILKGINKD